MTSSPFLCRISPPLRDRLGPLGRIMSSEALTRITFFSTVKGSEPKTCKGIWLTPTGDKGMELATTFGSFLCKYVLLVKPSWKKCLQKAAILLFYTVVLLLLFPKVIVILFWYGFIYLYFMFILIFFWNFCFQKSRIEEILKRYYLSVFQVSINLFKKSRIFEISRRYFETLNFRTPEKASVEMRGRNPREGGGRAWI